MSFLCTSLTNQRTSFRISRISSQLFSNNMRRVQRDSATDGLYFPGLEPSAVTDVLCFRRAHFHESYSLHVISLRRDALVEVGRQTDGARNAGLAGLWWKFRKYSLFAVSEDQPHER